MEKINNLLIIFLSIFICSKVYAYKEYKIGDEVTYNNIDFYVIKNSGSEEEYVTLLKKRPLTAEEVNLYGGVGTDNNHVNMYTSIRQGINVYKEAYVNGGMAYYSSSTCGFLVGEGGCTTNYENSEIKYVVDAWSNDKIDHNHLKMARLITIDELISEFEYDFSEDSNCYVGTETIPNWFYNDNDDDGYWTMSSVDESRLYVWVVYDYSVYSKKSEVCIQKVKNYLYTVRPVVEIYKCALDNSCNNSDIVNDTGDNKEIDDNKTENNEKFETAINNKRNESKEEVNVPNTLKSVSGLIILIGMVLVCMGLNIFMIVKNRSNK